MRIAQAAGEVQCAGEVPGGLAEGGFGGNRLLGLDEGALPVDRALLGAAEDRDVETDTVVFGGVVQAEDPVHGVLAGGLQLQFVAVVEIVRAVGTVFLEAVRDAWPGRRGEAGRHRCAAVLVEIGGAAEARIAGDIGQVQVIVDAVVDAAAQGADVAVQIRRRIDQGRPEFLARPRVLQQVHIGRAAVDEILVGDVPGEAVQRLPQRAEACRALVLRVIAGAALHEQVGVQRLERDRRADSLRVGVVGCNDRIGRGVLVGQRGMRRPLVFDVAVVLLVDESEAQRQRTADRQVERAARAVAVVVAQAALHAAEAIVQHRLGGLHVDRADGGVAAPQRALRPAQHFDGIHVEQQRGGALGARRIDAVDEQRDFGIGVLGLGAVVADAAHGHGDQAMIALRSGLEARDQVHQVLDGHDVGVIQRSRVQRGDGDRRLLQGGGALGRGDRDLLYDGGGSRVVGQGRPGPGEQRHHRRLHRQQRLPAKSFLLHSRYLLQHAPGDVVDSTHSPSCRGSCRGPGCSTEWIAAVTPAAPDPFSSPCFVVDCPPRQRSTCMPPLATRLDRDNTLESAVMIETAPF